MVLGRQPKHTTAQNTISSQIFLSRLEGLQSEKKDFLLFWRVFAAVLWHLANVTKKGAENRAGEETGPIARSDARMKIRERQGRAGLSGMSCIETCPALRHARLRDMHAFLFLAPFEPVVSPTS